MGKNKKVALILAGLLLSLSILYADPTRSQSQELEFQVTPFDGLQLNIPGRYILKSGEYQLRDLNGDGWIIRIASDNVALVCDGTVLIGFEDYTFETDYWVSAVLAEDRSNVTVEGCTFKNFNTALNFIGHSSHITVRNNRFIDNSNAAVSVADTEYVSGVPATVNSVRSRDIVIENNFIIGNTRIPTQTVRGLTFPCFYQVPGRAADPNCTGVWGIFLFGIGQAIVRENEIHNTALSAIRPDLIKDSLIENNTLDMSPLAIWSHAHGEFDLSDNVFRGNVISNAYVAIGVGSNGLRNTVEGNVILNTDSGIRIGGAGENPDWGRIYRHPAQETVLKGNRIYNSNWVGILVGSGQPAEPDDLLTAEISDNEVYQNGAAEGPLGGLVNSGILVIYDGPIHLIMNGNRIYDNRVNGILLANMAYVGQPVAGTGARGVIEIRDNTISNNGQWGVTAFIPDCVPDWPEEWTGISADSFTWTVRLSNNQIEGHELGDVCLPEQGD